jgi:hypothetical protein
MSSYFIATFSYSKPGNDESKNLIVSDRMMQLLLPSYFSLPILFHEIRYNEVFKLV